VPLESRIILWPTASRPSPPTAPTAGERGEEEGLAERRRHADTQFGPAGVQALEALLAEATPAAPAALAPPAYAVA